MNEVELKNAKNLERVTPWQKCVWKSNTFEKGEVNLGEGMQGVSILIVMKGAIRLFAAHDEESFSVQGQEFCLLSAAPPYKVMIEEEVHLLSCFFHTDIFPLDREMLALLHPFYGRERRVSVVLKVNEVIRAFTRLMGEYVERGIESESLCNLKRQELFLLLFATYPKEELAQFFFPLIGEGIQFKEFVISNYIKAKNVQHLAQMANYSTSGFIKKFIRCFNESPYQWMLRHKAKVIIDEIRSSQTSLKEISFKYNFSTYQHFVDFCKAQFGVTPSKLR